MSSFKTATSTHGPTWSPPPDADNGPRKRRPHEEETDGFVMEEQLKPLTAATVKKLKTNNTHSTSEGTYIHHFQLFLHQP